jgi:hypothetical protein
VQLYLTATAVMGGELVAYLQDAAILAHRLGCGIEFDFNGHTVWIEPGTDPVKQAAWFVRQWQRKADGASQILAPPNCS